MDSKPKTKEDLYKWVSKGLGKAAFYWFQTHGFPLELFVEEINRRYPTNGHKMIFVADLYKKGIIK